ncbi:MAG: hypothetical protein DRG58_03135 [Deltaproteobacteria bacterium]|nr:MAG: hypothetical protein DRG58_03135 [Deltaproteobacteria bacterium]
MRRPTFLYQQWLGDTLESYLTAHRPRKLKGRLLIMPVRQYGAALMQAYLGQFSLAWIAELTSILLLVLQSWRQETEFLLVMDWSKQVFVEHLWQRLTLHDYSIDQYHEIAGEYSLLETSLRVAGRTKLYETFRTLGERLIGRHKYKLELDTYDLHLFNRLLLFFLALEHYWPGPAGTRLQERFLPLAREVVWPQLRLAPDLESQLTAAQHKYSISQLSRALELQLRTVFDKLP